MYCPRPLDSRRYGNAPDSRSVAVFLERIVFLEFASRGCTSVYPLANRKWKVKLVPSTAGLSNININIKAKILDFWFLRQLYSTVAVLRNDAVDHERV